MSICGGPKEFPSEGPSGEDNCLDTQCTYWVQLPIQNEGQESPDRPKMAAQFLRHRVEQTELIHGLEQERRQPRCWQVPYRGDVELCSPLTCSVPLGSTQTEHKSFNTLKHALIKNLHSTSVLRNSICLINSSIHHCSVRRTLIFRHSQNTQRLTCNCCIQCQCQLHKIFIFFSKSDSASKSLSVPPKLSLGSKSLQLISFFFLSICSSSCRGFCVNYTFRPRLMLTRFVERSPSHHTYTFT